MHSTVFCSHNGIPLLIRQINLKIQFVVSIVCRRRCFFFCFCRCCLCGGSLSVCFCEEIVQFLDNDFIVFLTFIRGFLNIFKISVNCIQTLEQQINHLTVYLDFLAADFLEHIFHIMCQVLHSLKSHCAGHSF